MYLDTGCLVKLYYPEPNSAKVAALVGGQPLIYTPLHALELNNALSLKIFLKTGTSQNSAAVQQLISADLTNGVLVLPKMDWSIAFAEATQLAQRFTPSIGCRSLDILHCAAAQSLGASEFVSTDLRQQALAKALGLNLVVP